MKKLWILSACLVVFAATQALASDSRPVKEIFMWPVTCKCDDNGMHGDIYIAFAADKWRQVTLDGMNAYPKATPDGKLVGWLHGRHKDIWGDEEVAFLPNEVVVWRAGEVFRHIPAEGGDIIGWQFWNNGTQVAVSIGDRRDHPQSYYLYDLATLRKIGVAHYWKHPGSDTQQVPDWAEGMATAQGMGWSEHTPQ